MCTVCVVGVYRMCGGCVPYVWWVYTICVVGVYCMCGRCVLYVWWVCTVCVVGVYYVYVSLCLFLSTSGYIPVGMYLYVPVGVYLWVCTCMCRWVCTCGHAPTCGRAPVGLVVPYPFLYNSSPCRDSCPRIGDIMYNFGPFLRVSCSH